MIQAKCVYFAVVKGGVRLTRDRDKLTLNLLGVLAIASLVVILGEAPLVAIHADNIWLWVTYALMLFSAWVFPVRLGDQSVTITLGIEVPMFLQFGPLITVITIIVIWLLSQWLTGRTIQPRRLTSNLSMFTIMVATAYLGYRLSGGADAPISWSSPIAPLVGPVIAYMVLHFVSNYAITLWLAWTDESRRVDNWTLGVLWDLVALLGEILIAALLIVLQHNYGAIALFLTAVPFAGLIYMFRLYSHLLIANRQLSTISEISMKLNEVLHEDDLCQLLLDGALRLVSADSAYVFVQDDLDLVIPLAYAPHTHDMEMRVRMWRADGVQGMVERVWKSGEPVLQKVKPTRTGTSVGDGVMDAWPSIMAVPLRYGEQTLAVLVLAHQERKAFDRRNQETLQILASQAAIGLHNARKFAESTEQSLIDPLTGLYNYRYFEAALDKACRKADHTQTPLTLLVLDIDHFKGINDSYGHLAGNEVLKSFASLVKEQLRDVDTVCRYGGEEFTVLLPGAGPDVGMQIAERLRQTVAGHSVHLPSVGKTTPLPIRVTVSVGAASYPAMGDTPQDLLRNADRAMYIGSKQRGRNRAALYEQVRG